MINQSLSCQTVTQELESSTDTDYYNVTLNLLDSVSSCVDRIYSIISEYGSDVFKTSELLITNKLVCDSHIAKIEELLSVDGELDLPAIVEAKNAFISCQAQVEAILAN